MAERLARGAELTNEKNVFHARPLAQRRVYAIFSGKQSLPLEAAPRQSERVSR